MRTTLRYIKILYFTKKKKIMQNNFITKIILEYLEYT